MHNQSWHGPYKDLRYEGLCFDLYDASDGQYLPPTWSRQNPTFFDIHRARGGWCNSHGAGFYPYICPYGAIHLASNLASDD